MISKDLTQNIKTSLNTTRDQLGYILKQIDEQQQAENVCPFEGTPECPKVNCPLYGTPDCPYDLKTIELSSCCKIN